MDCPFNHFEQGIRRVAARHPEMPVGNVMLTRMLSYVSKALEDGANRFLAEFGLNNTHYTALMMIYASEDNMLNPCKLSEALLSSRANVTRLMDELAENGWVERQASTEDRRRIDLSLTPAGFALVEKILPRSWERIDRLWDGFSPEQIELTERTLRGLLSRISQRKDAADEDSCPA